MATLPKAYALFETTLQDSITSAATSLTMVKGTDKAGTTLSGTIGYIIDEGTASEEFVIASTSGTALSSMTRGIDTADGTTEVTALKKAHRKGASIKITNHPLLIRLYRIVNGDDAFPNNAQTLGDGSKLATSAAPTADEDIANKKYIDDTAIAGGAKATEVIYGLSKLSVAADSAVAPIAVGDNDTRVPTVNTSTVTADIVAALAGTGTPNGTTGKYVTLDSASATPTADTIPIADGSGKLDGWTSSQKALTAGETITGATLPVAVYQNTTDNEYYACDGNDTDKMKYQGFAISDGTDSNPITVQFSGVVSGFTGLSEGEKYYVQDDKTIGTTVGTYEVLVGIAISETQILIQKGGRFASGYITFDAIESSVITVGFRASKVSIQMFRHGSGFSFGGWTVFGGNKSVKTDSDGESTRATEAWYYYPTANDSMGGIVDTITNTSFRLNNTISGASYNQIYIYWEATGDL